jgi:hypothetical protein
MIIPNCPQNHRRSIHLKGYDYAQAGLYFITVCFNSWGCQLSGQVGGQAGGQVGGPINSFKVRKQEGLKLTYSNPKPPGCSELQTGLSSG